MPKKMTITDAKLLAMEDTYWFARYVLGYDKLESLVHGEWSRRFDASDCRRWLILRPRKTFKTTIYTISYAMRRLLVNPDLRILIVNAVEGNAAGFLREIKGHYERGVKFRQLFGDWISDKWNEGGISVKPRTSTQKELSIQVSGYGSTLVSAHYDLIIVDDLVNSDDRFSALTRNKKKEWYRDCISLLDEGGEIVIVGTRWHPDDLYNWIINDLNKMLSPQDRYVTEIDGCYLKDGTTPRYPDMLSESALNRIKTEVGPGDFAANYLNDPKPVGSRIFDIDTMAFFDGAGDVSQYDEIYGFCDPALGKSNLGCYSAVVTVGCRKSTTAIDVLDADLRRISPDALLVMIKQKHAFYRFTEFGIESNAFQERLIGELSALVPDLYVQGVPHRSEKAGRIQSLQPLVARGQLRFASDWRSRYPVLMDQLLNCQLDALPAYVDGPDALEGAVSLVKPVEVEEDTSWADDPYYGPSVRSRAAQEAEDIDDYEEDPYYAIV